MENDPRLTNPDYVRARKEWARYLSGDITADELQRNLKVTTNEEFPEDVIDMFDGKQIDSPATD